MESHVLKIDVPTLHRQSLDDLRELRGKWDHRSKAESKLHGVRPGQNDDLCGVPRRQISSVPAMRRKRVSLICKIFASRSIDDRSLGYCKKFTSASSKYMSNHGSF